MTTSAELRDPLDVDALRGWMQRHVPALVPPMAELSLQQYQNGFSNLTYQVEVTGGDASSRMVLRRPPEGVPPGPAHDMVREHGILTVLAPEGIPVPRPLACCDDVSVIGAPFYLMAHVEGLILRGATMPVQHAKAGDGATTRPVPLDVMSATVVDTLAALHAIPVTEGPLAALGRPEGYVARQVAGWSQRWTRSRLQPVRAMDQVADWLARYTPIPQRPSLLHNDFKLDNLVLDPETLAVRAILDWEMATVGDPLMDFGTTLAYWVEATDPPLFRALGLGVTALPGAMTRTQVIHHYAMATGRDLTDITFYHAFGVFKVAVIVQQLFARHAAGLTRDPRFARLGEVVQALAEQALRLTGQSAVG